MAELSSADLARLLEVGRRLQCAGDLQDFRFSALSGLRLLVQCDYASYNEVEPTGSQPAVTLDDPLASLEAEAYEGWPLYLHQHPALAHVAETGDLGPHAISDFVTRREFHRLDLYDVVFRPHGFEHQLAISVASSPAVIGLTVNRGGRDFTSAERLLLALAGPHLATAYEAAKLRDLADTLEQTRGARFGAILLGAPGSDAIAATSAARELLAAYFAPAARGLLPPEVAEWAASQHHRLAERGDVDVVSERLVVDGERGWLAIHFLPATGPGAPDRAFLEEHRHGLSASALAAAGLTRREIEVLSLLAHGLADKQIADELFLSLRTVRKHLEHVYRKLDVQSRTAAVACATELSAAL